MTFLPIVARELRVASRRAGTYWVRTGAGLMVMLLGCWFMMMDRFMKPTEMARMLFEIFAGGATFFTLLAGVRSTSDCLSQEKREGTLGLLFLTDLKGYDVVIGKLTASSVAASYGVLAAVPLLSVPILMGGVTPGEFGRTGLVVMNTLFFSLTAGLAVSGFMKSGRQAAGLTFLVLAVVAGGAPALAAYLQYGRHFPAYLCQHLSALSPMFGFSMALDQTYRGSSAAFWESLVAVHALAWVFLGVASLVAPRSWQERPAGAQKVRLREQWLNWSYGDAAERASFRRRLLDVNAFFWLNARARLKPAWVWTVLALLGCGWLWLALKFKSDWMSEPGYIVTGIVLNLLLKGWFASEVGRQLAEDRQSGALELLLSTPFKVEEIVAGQRLALQRQFLLPTLTVLGLFALFLGAGLPQAQNERAQWAWFWLGAIVMMVADLVALFWLGQWRALTEKNSQVASRGTVVRILVLPWMLFAGCVLLASMSIYNRQADPGWGFFFGLWLGLGLVVDFFYAGWARNKLMTEFRDAACRRFNAGAGFWRSILAALMGRTD